MIAFPGHPLKRLTGIGQVSHVQTPDAWRRETGPVWIRQVFTTGSAVAWDIIKGDVTCSVDGEPGDTDDWHFHRGAEGCSVS